MRKTATNVVESAHHSGRQAEHVGGALRGREVRREQERNGIEYPEKIVD